MNGTNGVTTYYTFSMTNAAAGMVWTNGQNVVIGTNITIATEQIVLAGAVTNWPSDPVLTISNINSCLVNGTGTLTRLMGNCLSLCTNIPLVITADTTLTAQGLPSILWLEVFAGTNQVTWITTAITNESTTALSTTETNSLIFTKGIGSTILKGKK